MHGQASAIERQRLVIDYSKAGFNQCDLVGRVGARGLYLHEELLEATRRHYCEHLPGLVANVSPTVTHVRRQNNDGAWRGIEFLVTTLETIDPAYHPKNLGLSGVSVRGRAFPGWGESFPHPECAVRLGGSGMDYNFCAMGRFSQALPARH